ncbi:related to salicylate hydroxylase [Phialocephala subalpina]|uniref:Related to salicylate hydroxylase n=1 Tax=Phialocephala subalpina TaxID=576137 RepID=A0A1L7XRG1_9HELO|nr:related to salicylate hydroxylase [Phialocephala subalpina]
MSSAFSVDVVIVGAGLGGLAAAIAIARAGHRVTIVERAPELGEVGAGIQVPPNSSRILDRWGILPKLRINSMQPEYLAIRSYRDGSILSLQNLTPLMEEVYGSPYLHVHRATFHTALCDEATRLGVKFRLGLAVIGVDFERPAVKVQGHEDIAADFILGADGLKSACREALLGRPDPPHASGDMAYRIIVSTDTMKKHKELVDFATIPSFNHWAGPGGHAVGYLIDHGDLFNMVIVVDDELPDDVYSTKGDLNKMHERFKDWNPKFRHLLRMVKEASLWKLQNSIEMESWRHPNGSFALLGDACHATLPYLAQGAAQAVEDGAVLGALFEKAENKAEIYDALGIYEELRKPRTTRVSRESTAYRAITHMDDGEKQRERDRQMTNYKPFEGYPNRWADPVFQEYLFGYDAYIIVAEAWSKYKVGKE